MTIPALDWGRVNSYRDGPLAAKDNQDWLRGQAEAIQQLKGEIDAMHLGHGTRDVAATPAGSPIAQPQETQLGGFVHPDGALGKMAQGAPLQFRGNMRESDYADVSNMAPGELVGRARALGVDKAEELPLAALQAAVMQRRADIPQEDHGLLFNMASQYARFGIQGARMVTGLLGQWDKAAANAGSAALDQTPTFFKDWAKDVFTRVDNAEQTRAYLAQMDESIRMNLTGKEQNSYLVRAAGDAFGQTIIGAGLAKAAMASFGTGIAPTLLGRAVTGAIGRGAITGAVVSAGFDVGSDKPYTPTMADFSSVLKSDQTIQQFGSNAANLLFGSKLMSAATGAAIGAAAGKLEQAFPTKQGSLNEEARQYANAAGEDQHWADINNTPGARADWANRFIERGDGIIDAEWSIIPDAPSPAPNVPQGPQGALESQYLRRLGPGDPPPPPSGGTGVASVEPIASAVTPDAGGQRLLQGPVNPTVAADVKYWENNADSYRRSIAAIEGGDDPLNHYVPRQGESGDPASVIAKLSEHHAASMETAQQIRQQAPRQTTTFEDAAPAIVQLKANMRDLNHRLELLPDNHPAIPFIGAELESMQGKLEAYRESAGGPPETSKNDPSPDFAFNQARPSPATPARELVAQAGTMYRGQDGNPLLLLHGGARVFDDVTREHLNSTANLFDGGFYLSSSPTVTGGDITDFEADNGYAGGRGAHLDGMRSEAKAQLQTLGSAMQAYQTQGSASGVTDEAAQQIQQQMAVHQQTLDTIGNAAPNVRPMFVAATRMLQAEAGLHEGNNTQDALDILREASQHSAWQSTEAKQAISTLAESVIQNGQKQITDELFLHGDGILSFVDLYHSLAEVADLSVHNGTPEPGKTSVNEVLEGMGYHGIEYAGGRRLRRTGEQHIAMAIFDPKRVVHAYLGEEATQQAAQALGQNLTKQNTILASEALPKLIGEAMPDDATVVKAQLTLDPGSFHILKGVADPVALMSKLASQDFHGELAGALKSYRMVVKPNGSVDIITSSLGEVTDKMVADYTTTGLFETMDVVNAKSGIESKVLKIGEKGQAYVQSASQKAKGKGGNWVKFSSLLPSNTATQMIEAPDLYSAFRDFAMTETSNRINQSGQAYDVSWFDDAVFHRLPDLTKEFLDQAGISDVGARAALARYFDVQRGEDARALAPEESRMFDAAEVKRDAIFEGNPETPDVHEYAALRGFSAVPSPNGVGYTLEDNLSPMKYPMKDENAVKEFLNTFQRDMPDHTPATPVPAEIADIPTTNQDHIPHTIEALHSAAIDDILHMEDYLDDPFGRFGGNGGEFNSGDRYSDGGPESIVIKAKPPSWMHRPQDNLGGTGFAGGPPPPPPNRPYRNLGSPESPRMLGSGTRADFVRKQLEGLSAADLRSRYQNALTHYFTPMRTFFSNMEEVLHQSGATGLTPWKDSDELNQLATIAHNTAHPIMEEIGKQLDIGRADNFYRNGKWMKIWAISDPGMRQVVASTEGFTVPEVQAMDHIDDQLRKMHGSDYQDGVSQFKDYFRKVSQAQARGDWSKNGYEPASENYPAISHFTQHAADVKARFLIADPRQVLPDFVRSFMFNKFAANKWNDTYATWNAVKNYEVDGKKPFGDIADDMLDWMDVTQKGFQPKGDKVLEAFHQTYNATLGKATGAPITRGESRKIFAKMISGFYNSVLGARIHVSVRDALQPFLAIPWTSAEHLAGTYADLHAGKPWDAMLARAEEAGVVTKGLHFETPGTFEGVVENTYEEGRFTPEQLARREMFASFADQTRDFFGARARKLAGMVKPLGIYGKQQEVQQVIVGEAAFRNFMSRAAEYTAGQANTLAGGGAPPTFKDFASKVGFDSFGNPFSRNIESLMNQGRLKDAAYTFMRQVALETQFGSGVRHAPAVTRYTAGRLGSALGNFSIQAANYVKRIAGGGNPRVVAAALGVAGGITATLQGLSRLSGWNFNALNPYNSVVGLVGATPVIQGVAGAVQAGASMASTLNSNQAGRTVFRQDQNNLTSLVSTQNLVGAVNKFNPLAGVGYNAEGAQIIADAQNPGLAALRFAMLGKTGMQADVGTEQFMDGLHGTRRDLRGQPTVSPLAKPIDRGSVSNPSAQLIQQQVDSGTHGKGGGAF